jgi:hypothetical protein
MNELQLQWQERTNTGTSWTHNESLRRMDTWLSRTYGRLTNFIIHYHQKEDR